MNRVHGWICGSGYWKRKLEEELLPRALDGLDLGDDVIEVGPGFGLTTDWLRRRHRRVTAVEIDRRLAQRLARTLGGANVRVVEGDGTALPFKDRSFSGAVAFTMLHHIPSPRLQDALLREVCRVVEPGAVFAGLDTVGGWAMRLAHIGDVLVPVDPARLAARLEAAGFTGVSVTLNRRRFRFSAKRG